MLSDGGFPFRQRQSSGATVSWIIDRYELHDAIQSINLVPYNITYNTKKCRNIQTTENTKYQKNIYVNIKNTEPTKDKNIQLSQLSCRSVFFNLAMVFIAYNEQNI